MIYTKLRNCFHEYLFCKKNTKIRVITYVVLVVILIEAFYLRISSDIQKDIGEKAILIATDFAKDINIDKNEFNRLISLDLNQLIKDDTNIKFEYKARYLMKYLDIKYIYIMSVIPDSQVKYKVEKDEESLYNKSEGTPLKDIYLLDAVINDIERNKDMTYGKYLNKDRYTIINDEYIKVSENKKAIYFLNKDKWGNYLTAYAPIYDNSGGFMGIIGVDICLKHYLRLANNNIYSIVGISIIISIIAIIKIIKLSKENYFANNKIKKLSVCSLTYALNRGSFMEKLKDEFDNSKKNKGHISIIFIDVDYFKEYNDNYGHIEGDKVLMKIGKSIINVAKKYSGVVGRYGGDEFIVLLNEVETSELKAIAMEISKEINKLKIKREYSHISEYQTVSIGVASIIPKEEEKIEDLINYADKALYKSKENGGNCICVWGEDLK
ncbi:diguanylate cyclase domain protein [Clostridium sporogenes]|uniref:Diguanylate cyclase domain protein n=1 Tax=Clostridium sporogenes TaxID=1509 RepID=A0A1L3NJP7_CLOSG|nr:GGDEF domain-containing protein [Clostridium sporogenes]APH16362.1 diguanylate cyclase domain protein [Clostridium sporogenes]